MSRKDERHGDFVAKLGDRLLGRYTDGGAGKTRDKRKARAVKRARKHNRRIKTCTRTLRRQVPELVTA